jgi:hypothetical protein
MNLQVISAVAVGESIDRDKLLEAIRRRMEVLLARF